MMTAAVIGLGLWSLVLTFLLLGSAMLRKADNDAQDDLNTSQDRINRTSVETLQSLLNVVSATQRQLDELYAANSFSVSRAKDFDKALTQLASGLDEVDQLVFALAELHEFELAGVAPKSDDGWVN